MSSAHVPQEIVDETLSYLRGDLPSLRACSLTHSCFYPTSHRLMFSRLKLGSRKNDLRPHQLHSLLSRFPDMSSHVDEIILRYTSSASNQEWPQNPPYLQRLQRICISNAYYSTADQSLLALLGSPSLLHLELHNLHDLPIALMLAAPPQSLKSLVLEQVYMMHPVDFEEGLNEHSYGGFINLESLTIEGSGNLSDSASVHCLLLDSRSRIVLSRVRRLAFISENSMFQKSCAILQECAVSLEHLEFRFRRQHRFNYWTTPFFTEPIVSAFPRLQSITFIFNPADHAAPVSRASHILAIASESSSPLLEEIILRFNIRVSLGNEWSDKGMPAMDLGLSKIPSLAKVTILIRIMNRGKHSITEHTAFIRSCMPQTDARGILSIERVFPI
ncbi:hypothetical protein FB451DRAFT_1374237 [Mycena latifolia]|nr:hypothetical protein FB451DRAFT_1374237 [Mycena latifolia]